MLEQIGYIYRFYKKYCNEGEEKDEEKCYKKLNKYMERYESAIYFLGKHATINVSTVTTRRQSVALPAGGQALKRYKYNKSKSKIKRKYNKQKTIRINRLQKDNKQKTLRIIRLTKRTKK
jgi:hypothetical protein